MSGQTPVLEVLRGETFGLVADAHVHPGGGPALPTAVSEAFARADAVIALGDMGESAALDALERMAPVLAVRGADDSADDARVVRERRLFEHRVRLIGAVFDGTAQGLFTSNDPLEPVPDFASAARSVFGRRPDVILCAASHKPLLAWCEGILIVKPGSPTLADRCTVALLHVHPGHVSVEHLNV